MEIKRLYDLRTISLFVVLLVIASLALGNFGYFGRAINMSYPCQGEYGFPFSFITHCESFISGETGRGFDFQYFLFDVIIWYLVSLVIFLLYDTIKSYKSQKTKT